ncbi:MAG: YtxH domain-containing protein [Saprospiraceae bacterium]|jgi:uncharacterized membrane protein|nr:YtxH domain-containing protein [Saprospiraceae bacterium]
MDAKSKAIVAHITLIGWIVALVLNQNEKKEELASFYIRQVLGIFLLGVVCSIIPILNLFLWIIPLVFWIISLVGAIGGTEKELPIVGKYFQDWFKSL